jgi:WD40 repeat protein
MWDLTVGTLLRCFVGHNEFVDSVAFAGDGRRAVSTSDDILGTTPDNGMLL